MDGSALLGIGLVLLFIGSGLFYFLVYPIWMVIDAGISERSSTSKALWIIGMVITWSVGSVVYGTFAASRTIARVFGVIGLLFVLASGGILIAVLLFSGPLYDSMSEQLVQAVAAVDAPELSSEEKLQMVNGAKEVFVQFSNFPENPEQLQEAVPLIQTLVSIMEDGQITRAEYEGWMRLVEQQENAAQ